MTGPEFAQAQAPTPATDDEARMRAFQIIGSDITDVWTGNWHESLRVASATWSGEPVWRCRHCNTPNSYWTDTCGHCDLFRAPSADIQPAA